MAAGSTLARNVAATVLEAADRLGSVTAAGAIET
jgi:hypothetical protein